MSEISAVVRDRVLRALRDAHAEGFEAGASHVGHSDAVVADPEGILAVLHDVHWRATGSAIWALAPDACLLCGHQAARVVEYLTGAGDVE